MRAFIVMLLVLLNLTVSAQLMLDCYVSPSMPITAQQANALPVATAFWKDNLTGYLLDPYTRGWIPTLKVDVSGRNLGDDILGYAYVTGVQEFWVSGLGPVPRSFAYPSGAVMVLNTAFSRSISDPVWAQIIEHELGHALGFGTLWNYAKFNRVSVYTKGTGQYIGPFGLQAYRAETGNWGATYVPVELDGGSGTADSHWDAGEPGSFFYRDLEAGWISISRGCTVSETTIASMRDLGYTTRTLAVDSIIPEPSVFAGFSVPIFGFLLLRRRKK